MIATVTLNPCLHKMIVFRSDMRREKVVRPVTSWYQAGGKGINVARAASRLGAEALAISTCGGFTGDLFAQALAGEGFACRLVPVAAPTRMSTSLLESDTRVFSEYLEAGAPVAAAEAEALFEATLELAGGATHVALSGSSPDQSLDDFFARVIERVNGKARIAVDTYGAPARRLLEARPALFKANRDELCSTFGLEGSVESIDRFARERLDVGCGHVLVTGGRAGATLYGKDGVVEISSPSVEEQNPVGSGDAMLGAILAGLERGATMLEACRLGAAAGGANAARMGVCDFESAQVESLVLQIHWRERPSKA